MSELEKIRGRLHRRNKNWVGVIIGESGSGKSWAALRIAEEVDPNFNASQIVFTTKELFQLISSGKLKRGSMIVYDESGIDYGSRDYFTEANKRMSKLLQRFRKRNYGLILTIPDISFLDSQGRRMIHNLLETQSVNIEEQYSRIKWKVRKSNPKLGGESRFVFVRSKQGILRFVRIHKASDKIINQYEDKKEVFMKEQDQKDIERVEAQENKEQYFLDRYKEPNAKCVCGHSWYYKGSLKKARCSSCNAGVAVE